MMDMTALQARIAAQDWAGAERMLRRAAKSKGAGAQVFYNLGKVLQAGGKGAQSGAWFKKAVAADQGYAIAWFELGRWAIDADDLTLAERCFDKAAMLAPDDADAWRNLGRVRLRLGDWAAARTAWDRLGEDAEVLTARYRIAAELGEDTAALQATLLAQADMRPEAMKALVRVAKGSVPLRFPPLAGAAPE